MEDENCNENSKEYMKTHSNVRLCWLCSERENFLFHAVLYKYEPCVQICLVFKSSRILLCCITYRFYWFLAIVNVTFEGDRIWIV